MKTKIFIITILIVLLLTGCEQETSNKNNVKNTIESYDEVIKEFYSNLIEDNISDYLPKELRDCEDIYMTADEIDNVIEYRNKYYDQIISKVEVYPDYDAILSIDDTEQAISEIYGVDIKLEDVKSFTTKLCFLREIKQKELDEKEESKDKDKDDEKEFNDYDSRMIVNIVAVKIEDHYYVVPILYEYVVYENRLSIEDINIIEEEITNIMP